MRILKRLALAAVLLLIIGAAVRLPVLAQDGVREFSNGLTVSDPFLSFYETAPDPYLSFGLPISAEIPTADGRTLQFFQRAVFELVGDQVHLLPLGEQYYLPLEAAQVGDRLLACRAVGADGYRVCYDFLTYYETNDGPRLLGDPIAEMEQDAQGRFQQCFRSGCLEWRPENPSGQRVIPQELGTLAYSQSYGLTDGGAVGSAPVAAPQSTTLQAHAFVSQALIPGGSPQSLYVVVQDQNFNPVEGASVAVTVHYPNNRYDARITPSDANGISQTNFDVGFYPFKEIVRVDITVEKDGLTAKTATWFRIWW